MSRDEAAAFERAVSRGLITPDQLEAASPGWSERQLDLDARVQDALNRMGSPSTFSIQAVIASADAAEAQAKVTLGTVAAQRHAASQAQAQIAAAPDVGSKDVVLAISGLRETLVDQLETSAAVLAQVAGGTKTVAEVLIRIENANRTIPRLTWALVTLTVFLVILGAPPVVKDYWPGVRDLLNGLLSPLGRFIP